MSEKDDQIEVEIEPGETIEKEPQVEVVDDVKAQKEEDPPIISPEEGIQELRRRLDDERRRREEAEYYARYAAEQAEKFAQQKSETEFHLVANAYDKVKQENDILKAGMRDAMAIGDHDKAAELQEALSMNAVRLNQLEMGKRDMETRPRQSAFQPPPPPPPSQPVGDPIDQIIASVSKPSAEWIQRNRKALQNESDIQDMFDAHNSAVRRGFAPDTEGYFRYVEQKMGISRSDSGFDAPASAPIQRKAAPPAAPVSRNGSGTGSSNPNVVRLTKEQAEFARLNNMTEKEYAKHLMDLRKEGKIAH